MRTERRGAATCEVQYVLLHDSSNPVLLARVRWPDVFQAISPARPEWQADPGLLDLPYDPSSTALTPERAAAIAAEWGAEFPSADQGMVPGPSLIRRMPANWSELSPAVKRAWSIEPVKTRRLDRWRRRRNGVSPALEQSKGPHDDRLRLLDVEPAQIIDLTDERQIDLTDATQDALKTVEDA